jgi:hypothetical protein
VAYATATQARNNALREELVHKTLVTATPFFYLPWQTKATAFMCGCAKK